jgi:hypothetical protein
VCNDLRKSNECIFMELEVYEYYDGYERLWEDE